MGRHGRWMARPPNRPPYNVSLPFGVCPVIATQIAPCLHKDPPLPLKAWPTASKKTSIQLQVSHFVRRWNMFHLFCVHPGGHAGMAFGGGLKGKVNFSHQSSSDINHNRNLESITKNKQRHSGRVWGRNLRQRQRLCKPKWWLSWRREDVWMSTPIAR